MKQILIVILTFILLSCSPLKQVVEVPVESVRVEYIHDTRVDSVYSRDSIDRYMKGDTLFIYKESTKFKYINKTDTIIKVDSIPKIVKVSTIKEVNKVKWW